MKPQRPKGFEHLNETQIHNWRARLKKRRGKTFDPVQIRELNLVAMMDMMTLILVFLLKSYSVSAMSIPTGKTVNPPKSSAIIRPVEAVKLTVTEVKSGTGVIAVDEEEVLALTPQKLNELERMTRERKFMIPDLQKKLQSKAEGIKYIASKNPSIKFEGRILVIADKETPYWLITQVLFTAAAAEFERYHLVAVREKEE